jgi:hypothetical protein
VPLHWLAEHNKLIFDSLFVLGEFVVVWCWESSTVKQIMKAGSLYFALLHAVGFALGTIRTLWVASTLGARKAEIVGHDSLAELQGQVGFVEGKRNAVCQAHATNSHHARLLSARAVMPRSRWPAQFPCRLRGPWAYGQECAYLPQIRSAL